MPVAEEKEEKGSGNGRSEEKKKEKKNMREVKRRGEQVRKYL